MATKTGTAKRAPQTTPSHVATLPLRGKPAHRVQEVRRPRRHAGEMAVGRRGAPNFVASLPSQSRISRLPRRLVLVFSIAFMLAGAAFLIYPFIPMIRYAIAQPTPVAPYETRLFDAIDLLTLDIGDAAANNTNAVPAANAASNQRVSSRPLVSRPKNRAVKPKPIDNRLVIPKIGVDVPIIEGANQDVALMQGIWHIPGTSSPDKGSNTVLSGHRFRYLSGPRTLYLLDKLQKGDPIIIYWKGKEYDYRVTGRKIVKPNQVEILDPTKKPRLTIFTCSPLFSTKERLVLIADPI